ncbi:MAG: S-layer homology domain-containing protein [Clostridia bacterium]|nr:S-layer homology domain-containing protein [Clostridia bacterium]
MSKIKKLIALTLALAMVLSVSAFAGSYKADTYADADKINEDCQDAVELLYALDIMVGDGKNFNPESAVTRAEMAKMIYVILNYGDDDKAVTYTGAKFFSDVEAGYWAEGYINYCAATKLIAGRGDGKFDPTAPVTCAEAAKMMLTAIGYSAEARGYVGANWDKNVLADASIIGLLSGYKANVNTYAPRQWVAVMFENLLLKAYTFGTMTPNFNGLLVSGSQFNPENAYEKMGQKYYGLNDKTAYLYATDSAYIDVLTDKDGKAISDYAEDGWLLFSNGVTVKSSALGYMDLGQEFRVIYKDGGKTVYSIRNTGTSEIGEAAKKDISYEIVRSTSSNEANNKYQFTFGDLTAKFEGDGIKLLKIAKRGATAKVAPQSKSYDADDLVGWLPEITTEFFHVVDKNGDGEIDYMIVKDYSYAQVEKVAEHKAYGEYFTAKGTDGKAFKADGFKAISGNSATTQWYLDDVVNTEDTIEEGNVIKVVYNPDNGKYDVEVLPVAEGVTYDKKSAKGVYTLGGEDYKIAADGWTETAAEYLQAKYLKDEMNVVYDDNLIVMVKPVDSDYTDLADINAQLVMVTEAYVDIYENADYNRYYIDYMTIDGEMHEEVRYVDGKHGTLKDSQELDPADADVNYSEIAGYLAENQRLFVLVESGSGVYLKKLTADNAQDILDYSDSLLSGYREDSATLDTEDNKFGSDFVANENAFFVSYTKPGKTTMYFDVLTLDDLGEGAATGSFIQGLYKTKRTVDTYLAGHIYIDGLELAKAGGYVYFTEDLEIYTTEWASGEYDYEVYGYVFADGYAPETEYILVDTDSDTLYANRLYSYTYEKTKSNERIFTLTLIDELAGTSISTTELAAFDLEGDWATGYSEIVDNGASKLIVKEGDGDLLDIKVTDDTVVALKKVFFGTDIAGVGRDHDDPAVIDEVTFEFTTFEDLVAETDGEYDNFIAGGETSDYIYISDYYAVGSETWATADDVLYVVVYAYMVDAND